MDFERIARPEIVAMRPYASARREAAADGLLLNANEAPAPNVEGEPWGRLSLHRYPPPQPAALVGRLAEIYGVDVSRVLVTRGSDEGIDLLTRVFCRPAEDVIVQCPPCFGMYRVAAEIQGARVIDVQRAAGTGLRIDFDRLCETVSQQPGVRLVFLTSPNNPTGETIRRADLERVLEACGENSLLVLDEAYIEFARTGSATRLLDAWPNLVVLRTLSKALAAAGARCGSVIADPAVISLLQRVMAPYPLAVTAIDAALEAVSDDALAGARALVETVASGRVRLTGFLESCDWAGEVWHGEANFVLVRVADATGLVEFCARNGVRIRDFSRQSQLEDCVRMTVGSDSDTATLIGVLEHYGRQRTADG